MRTTIRETPEASTLFLSGRFTVGAQRDPLPHLVGACVAHGARRVAIDLGAVSYMDCACLGEVIDAATMLAVVGGQLTLTRVPARIQRLLDVSRVGQVLPLPPAGPLRRTAHDARRRSPWTGAVA